MENLRLFVAVELPEDVKAELGTLQNRLSRQGLENLKWVAPDSLHITLKFLGHVSPDTVTEISRCLDGLSRRFNPFDIGIKGLGAFPGLSRPQVLWVGLSGEIGRLQMIAGEVEEALVALDFKREKRRFTPHLTIARVRSGNRAAEQAALAAVVSRSTFNLSCTVRVKSVSLMQSQLSPAGAKYTRLHMAKLNASKAK